MILRTTSGKMFSDVYVIGEGLAADQTNAVTFGLEDGDEVAELKVIFVGGEEKVFKEVKVDEVCIVGSQGGDLLAEFVLAMKHKLGLGKILATIHPYPTWAEGNKYLAGEWRKAHQPERILRLLARFFRWQRGG